MGPRNTNSHFTPLTDFEENCERTLAVLRIYPGEITPPEVTELLGVSQPLPSLRESISSESFVESRDLRRHLDWLLDKVEPGSDGLNVLQQRPGVRMCVYCIWWSRHGGGPTLWPERMRRLAALNLECSFDIQYYGEDGAQIQKCRLVSRRRKLPSAGPLPPESPVTQHINAAASFSCSRCTDVFRANRRSIRS